MTRKSAHADLTLYLAKRKVEAPSEILKKPEALKVFELTVAGVESCVLYVKPSHATPPKWAAFFSEEIDIAALGQNESTAAVLYVKMEEALFLLAFGQGRHLIDDALLDLDFGLKAVLNMVDIKSLRSMDKASFEGKPKQVREQTGVATEIEGFSVSVEHDLLRAVTGKPLDEAFGKRVSGMDALKLGIEVTPQGLAPLLLRILEVYRSDEYKKRFAWIDHISAVKDKLLREQLDAKLLERLNGGDFDRAWLSVPDMIDWGQVVGFKYSEARSAPRCYDIRLPEFMETLNGKALDVACLKHRKIVSVDTDDNIIYKKSAYYFLYAELDYQENVYLLNNGKWYKISSGYADKINAFFQSAPRYAKPLPVYDDDTEGAYNARVARENPGEFVLMDAKNIRVTGAASPVEPCDLFRGGHEFIHVKRYGGSDVLSHLFNQGLSSGELFQMEPEFRELLNARLPQSVEIRDTKRSPERNAYEVVFAIISEADEGLSIPFFSKISLRHVMTRLQAMGFAVSVTKIAVDETRKKIKKYQAKNKKKRKH